MISQLEFDPSDYHLRVMIEDMERDGRSEHAIEEAVRAATDWGATAKTPATENRGSGMCGRGLTRWAQIVRQWALHRTGDAVRCP